MTSKNTKIKKPLRLPRIIVRTVLSIIALIIFYFTLTVLLFFIFKNDISKTLLSGLNQNINGSISFSDISITPFKHLPDIALGISDLKLEEYTRTDSSDKSILNIKDIYLTVNIIDLFSSQISASRITIEHGFINLIVYPDSMTNLDKVFGRKKPGAVPDSQEDKYVTEQRSDLDLSIENLIISDLKINAENFLTDNKLIFSVKKFESQLEYNEENIFTDFILDITLDSMIVKNNSILTNNNIFMESKLYINPDSGYIKVKDGKLIFDEARFELNGTFNSKNEGDIDLLITGKDLSTGLFSFVLNETGKKNIKSGTAKFNALVKGKTYTHFPEVDLNFSLTDVSLLNPKTNRLIKNLNLKGYFNSGGKNDFSQAILNVDTLYADFPDGTLKLSGKFKNFTSPEIDIMLVLDADMTGWNEIFNLENFDVLHGKITIEERFKGKYLPDQGKIKSEVNNLTIAFVDFGFGIQNALRLDKINGTIIRENDSYSLKDLSITYQDSDLLINGGLENLQYLFFGVEKEINASLNIKSSVFDLPNFLFFDPTIKRDFNYRILDVDLSVIAKTTTTKAVNFKSFPEIEFEIKKLYATAEKFLPELKIKSGKFKISEDILGFNLKFDNFKTEFLNGPFNFTAEYNTSKFQPYYIKLKSDFRNINPSKLIYLESDTIPESMNGKLSGSFFVEFQFPTDSTVLKFIDFRDGNLSYEFSDDTVFTSNLSFRFDDIYFNDKTDPNPLATLSTKGKLKAGSIQSNEFKLNDLSFDITIKEGTYEIKSDKTRFFGEKSHGTSDWIVKPFGKIPSFNFKSEVKKFYAEEMLASYMEKEIISGPLSMKLELHSEGSDWNNLVNNMNGQINLKGENLLISGLDVDNLLEKFKRSQSFNLVDLGGVLLAGPVGLVVTKGTDYARLLVLNSGESSKLNNLVSNWTIINGEFKIEDAAFTTSKNRIALQGSINLSQDSLTLVVALLDENGCSTFSQEISGKLNSPVPGKVNVGGTIAAPVTNLYDDIVGKDCEAFYKGSLKHPK